MCRLNKLGVLYMVLALSVWKGESRPTPTLESLNTLERALRDVLTELECRRPDLTELAHDFQWNINITMDVAERLREIFVPINCTHTVPLHYLDFRSSVVSECANQSKPRIRRIESATTVFPTHYMDWECTGSCSGERTQAVRNYELLQRTDGCSDGMEKWIGVEAATMYPLEVTLTCRPS